MRFTEAAAGDLEGLPAMLTVAETARVLRIGRTLAYELASRFLDGDPAGIPAIRLGGCLRVPRWALIEFIHHGRVVSDLNATVAAAIDAQLGEPAEIAPTVARRRTAHRKSPRSTAQLSLAIDS